VLGYSSFRGFLAGDGPAELCVHFALNKVLGGTLVLLQVGGSVSFAGGNLPAEIVRHFGAHDVLLNPCHLLVVHLDGRTSTAAF